MNHHTQLVDRPLAVDEYQMLREAVGWARVDTEAVECGLHADLYSVCAERFGGIIGCGRVVGDGGIYLYVQDVIVLPEFQGQGIGRRLMDRIMEYVERTAGRNTMVGLMAAKDVATFYERYGFEPRPANRPGMYRMWS